jgi:hypothetical protein
LFSRKQTFIPGFLNEIRLCVDLCKNWRPFSWKAQVFEWIVEKCMCFLSNCEWKIVLKKFVGLSIKNNRLGVQFHEVEGPVCGKT